MTRRRQADSPRARHAGPTSIRPIRRPRCNVGDSKLSALAALRSIGSHDMGLIAPACGFVSYQRVRISGFVVPTSTRASPTPSKSYGHLPSASAIALTRTSPPPRRILRRIWSEPPYPSRPLGHLARSSGASGRPSPARRASPLPVSAPPSRRTASPR